MCTRLSWEGPGGWLDGLNTKPPQQLSSLAMPPRAETSDDLTIAAGGGEDVPRQAQGFWLASGEIMSMMLSMGVIVVGVWRLAL